MDRSFGRYRADTDDGIPIPLAQVARLGGVLSRRVRGFDDELHYSSQQGRAVLGYANRIETLIQLLFVRCVWLAAILSDPPGASHFTAREHLDCFGSQVLSGRTFLSILLA